MSDREVEIIRVENKILLLNKLKEKYKLSSSEEDFLEIRKIYWELDRAAEELIILKGPKYSNGVLDLYLDENHYGKDEEKYNIALTGEHTWIGFVRITYTLFDIFFANIGYELNKSARGNGYMIQALELLKEPMLEKGLEKPLISVDPNNIPSVRTIEKFGGKKIDNGNKWYDTYEVDLNEDNYKKSR